MVTSMWYTTRAYLNIQDVIETLTFSEEKKNTKEEENENSYNS